MNLKEQIKEELINHAIYCRDLNLNREVDIRYSLKLEKTTNDILKVVIENSPKKKEFFDKNCQDAWRLGYNQAIDDIKERLIGND